MAANPRSPGPPKTNVRSQLTDAASGDHNVTQETTSPTKAKRRSDCSAEHHVKANSLSSRTTARSSIQAGHHQEHGEVRTLPRKCISHILLRCIVLTLPSL